MRPLSRYRPATATGQSPQRENGAVGAALNSRDVVVVGAAVAIALGTLTACSTATPGLPHSSAAGQAGPANTLTPSCPAPPDPAARPPVTVAELNTLVARVDLPGWQSADIGASARLTDGRLVWVFGDTVREAGWRPLVVANSILVSSGRCAAQLVTPTRGPAIPDRADGTVFWPMSLAVIRRPGADVVVVLCARIHRGTSDAFDFTYLGSSAAIFAVGTGAAPQLREVMDLTSDASDAHQVGWGAASVIAGDWLYVYGTRLPPGSFGRALYVARAPVADPQTRAGWRFWDGTRWQSDRALAAPVIEAKGGVSQTLSVDVADGHFLAVSKRDGDLGDFVFTWTAPSPVGPWTPHRGIAAPFEDSSGILRYAPLAHPEIALASGRLLVSISRNTSDFERLLTDPTSGRPVFAEIPWPDRAAATADTAPSGPAGMR